MLVSFKSVLYLFIFSFLLFSCTEPKESTQGNANHEPLFSELLPTGTGIDFKNTLTEDLTNGMNILDFDYFFNGAGVALSDLDKDGLIDIVFSANQTENKIYKNLGNLKFEDVTQNSGINKGKNWSTGVSIVDINLDGLEDIYISQGGPYFPEQRKNLLYINKGNFIFEEQAETYNLADTGISSQAVFFDFDKDGDQDCIVVNESPLIGYDPVRFYKILSNNDKALWQSSTSHLYRNDNNHFVDITERTDIDKPSFGLGVCVSDLNSDGWSDIYIANDYYIPDAIYINDKKGGFSDQTKTYTNQLSFFGMGVDIADLNNDTHKDILVLDMASEDHIRAKTLMESMDVDNFRLLTEKLKFPYQYMFNSLQLNNGANRYDNTAHAMGLAKTDWSWAGLITDFDLDGDKDVLVTNGYRKYAKDNDFRIKVTNLLNKYQGKVPLEEKQKIYNEIPSEKLHNLYFENTNNGFKRHTGEVGINTPTFSNGAAYADLDNDGDYDLVVNNIDQVASIYKNNTIETSSKNSIKIVNDLKDLNKPFSATIKSKGISQVYESNRVRGYLSSCSKDIIIGIDKEDIIDEVKISIYGGPTQIIKNVKASSVINLSDVTIEEEIITNKAKSFKEISTNKLSVNFIHRENNYDDFAKEILLPYKQSTLGPFITVDDINNDGLQDFYISGALGQTGQMFTQQQDGTYKSSRITGSKNSVEEMKASFLDINNDGHKDIYLPSGGNSQSDPSHYIDQIITNNGNQEYSKRSSAFTDSQYSGKTSITIDYDNDGDDDLFVGNRINIQAYPLAANSFLFDNNNGEFTDITKESFDQTSFGIINDVVATDYNADGWQDLIIVGEWNSIQFWTNKKGRFKNETDILLGEKLDGWWNKVLPIDINNDNRTDYVIGNLGINSKYNGDKIKPLNVYANDFDKNGTLDIVLSKKYKGKEVPYRGKECSSEQMPFINESFESYQSFATASLKDIYGNELSRANKSSINEFKSIVLVQKQDGKFTKHYLPFEAQLRPILDAITIDLNDDNYSDLIAIGNIYNTEPETPRLDYHNATVLISDKKGNFYFDQDLSNQLAINGNSKSIGLLQRKNANNIVLIGINNSAPKAFEILK